MASFLAVAAAWYAIHAHNLREQKRAVADRRDRRRERLLHLYADWGSRILESVGRAAQWIEQRRFVRERLNAEPNPSLDAALVSAAKSAFESTSPSLLELNRASLAICLEEGEQLWADVRDLTFRAIKLQEKAAMEGVDAGVESVHEALRKLMEHRRLANDLGAR